MHRAGAARIGAFGVPVNGQFDVRSCAPAVFIHQSEDVHRRGVTTLGTVPKELKECGRVFCRGAESLVDRFYCSFSLWMAQPGGEQKAFENFIVVNRALSITQHFHAALIERPRESSAAGSQSSLIGVGANEAIELLDRLDEVV